MKWILIFCSHQMVLGWAFLLINLSVSMAQNNPHQAVYSGRFDKQFFIENKGQWPSEVLFLAKLGGLYAWITNAGVNYSHFIKEDKPQVLTQIVPPNKRDKIDYEIKGQRILVGYQGANQDAGKRVKDKQEGFLNYFIGRDSSKYATEVARYKEVVITDVYEGIDVRYYFQEGKFRYDFIVHPGADPSQIQLHIEGAGDTKIIKNELVFSTCLGEIYHKDLQAYQTYDNTRFQIQAQWQKKGEFFGFNLPDYNPTETLIIDPLVYSTYVGGGLEDVSCDIALNSSGNAYITGRTLSLNYDVTPGVFQTVNEGGYDAFITKLNAGGSGLSFSTYFGGGADDLSNSIALGPTGNAYVCGHTLSTDFSVTPGAYQNTIAGANDVFIARLNNSGTSLTYSSLLGGSNDDFGFGIAVNSAGHAFVTGSTMSTDFDVIDSAFQFTNNGLLDVFVARINATGSSLIYSTYLGGSYMDYSYGITVDDANKAYIVGASNSFDYDFTPFSQQDYIIFASFDAIISVVSDSGTQLLYSTAYGSYEEDIGYDLTLSNDGKVYFTGTTRDLDFFGNTFNGYQASNHGLRDAFVAQVIPTLGALSIITTFCGGNADDVGTSIVMDTLDNVYITGYTNSYDYPVQSVAYQTAKSGDMEVFMTQFNPNLTHLLYSTFLGGNNVDYGNGIAIDNLGYGYVTGSTFSNDFDVSSNGFQTSNQGEYDAFVTKYCIVPILISLVPTNTNQSVCVNSQIKKIFHSTSGTTNLVVNGLPAGLTGAFEGSNFVISGVPSEDGIFNYTFTYNSHCGTSTAIGGTITVNPCMDIETFTENDLSIDIYPNPTSASFTLQLTAPGHVGGTLHISDMNGRRLASHLITQANSFISTEALAPGIYSLAYERPGKLTWRGKLCVVR